MIFTRRRICLNLVIALLAALWLAGCSPGVPMPSAETPVSPAAPTQAVTAQETPRAAADLPGAAEPPAGASQTTPDPSPTSPPPSLSATSPRPKSPSATIAPTATPAVCAQDTGSLASELLPSGTIITATLQTRLVRAPLSYRVYLPPCYAERPGERYPSLYLFHGQSYNDDQWDRMGIDETADRLIAAGKIPPLIIVMPYDRYGGQPTETGFSDVIVKELIPTIDTAYRTRPERRYRAVGGLSRGAGWAIHFGIGSWELFGRLGAHSAAVFHTDAQRMRTWIGKIPADQLPQVYLDIGDRDRPEITRSTEWFADLLNLYDVPHEYHLFSGYHSEDYWSAHLQDYLLWYTRDWVSQR